LTRSSARQAGWGWGEAAAVTFEETQAEQSKVFIEKAREVLVKKRGVFFTSENPKESQLY
jgi:hypothetical protein